MFYKTLIILFLLVAFQSKMVADNQISDYKNKKLNKVSNNDDYNLISANEILMWLSNNGDGSHDPTTDGSGLYWPGGINAENAAIFEDGLVWGGKVNGEIRVGGSTYRHGLQAGKILESGSADNPELDKYRIYRIRKDFQTMDEDIDLNSNGVADKDEIIIDWQEWPVEDGAPWVDMDADGVYNPDVNTPFEADHPDILGDEMLWFVANDLDSSRTNRLFGSPPMGLEMQTTVFAFNRVGDLGNIIFKKYLLINKGNNVITDMYLAQWSDPDLGNADDDFAGCDTNLSLGYVYNGDNNDESGYGANPPAAGYDFFQGPIVESSNPNDSAKFLDEWRYGYKNLPMTAYTFNINGHPVYQDPELGTYAGAIEMYNNLTSKTIQGNAFVDPNTDEAVDFVLAGDPVEGTGWYQGDGWPGGPGPSDIRILMASGPFTMQPNDSQEVVIGVILGKGNNNIESITKIRENSISAQSVYDNDFKVTNVNNEFLGKPENFNLYQNYPNPFNPTTTIKFGLPKDSDVKVNVYSILGEKVETLVDRELISGYHEVEFDASHYSSGIYFYSIQAGEFTDVKKMIFMK